MSNVQEGILPCDLFHDVFDVPRQNRPQTPVRGIRWHVYCHYLYPAGGAGGSGASAVRALDPGEHRVRTRGVLAGARGGRREERQRPRLHHGDERQVRDRGWREGCPALR